MNLKKNFGLKLKQIRQKQGFTQEMLAEKIGLNTRQISKIETGDHLPSANTIEKICTVLEVLPQELFTFEKKQIQVPNEKIKLLNSIAKLIQEDKYYKYIYLTVKALKSKKAMHDLLITIEGMNLSG